MPEEPVRYDLAELTLGLYKLFQDEVNEKRIRAYAGHLSRVYQVYVDPQQVIAGELERVESRVHTPPKRTVSLFACLCLWMKRWAGEQGRVSPTDARPKIVSIQSTLRDGGTRERSLATKEPTPEEAILDAERAKVLDDILAEVRRDAFAYSVLQLRMDGVMKPAEIADQLGCRVQRVYKVIQKTKELFRERVRTSNV